MIHLTFTRLRQVQIPSLNITVEEYQHQTTGARHLHIITEDDHNAFLVAFLTVPEDSTGVAHILEHTTLCGSQRYPVRDPFFMMSRRSLSTFMNAITGSDWTAYPFASQNVKDFNNLLQVYLDAAFFPNLHELDFAQEGYRVEFAIPNNPDSALVYKGVVFNEMKGSLSSPISYLWRKVHFYLYPTITYHNNSGGDPNEIPKLTHAQLKAFHARHYHPSNAVFMTYGNRPAAKHQEMFEQCVLRHFQTQNSNLRIPAEQRYQQPLQVVTHYPFDESDTHNKTHIVLAWLLGKNTDLRETMNAHLLNGVLLDNSASPLRHALESTTLGTSPSSLCGFDESHSETSFMCGLEGSNPEQADAVEALILQILESVEQKGVPLAQVESVLHQMELSQREISGNGMPYGLHLLLNMLSPTLHGGDPVAALDIDPVLTTLRADCQDSRFIPNLVRRLLLDNPHRVRVVMAPDKHLAEQWATEETARLASLKASLSAEDKTRILTQTAALQTRQQEPDDPELLPKVGLEDISEELKIAEGTSGTIADLPVTWFAQGTNGIVYQAIVLDLPDFSNELLDILPLFCDCVTEVGCSDKDYLETAAWQASISGGVSARLSVRGSTMDVHTVKSFFVLSSKSLVRNQPSLVTLLQETLERARFDELGRLRELIAQFCTDAESSIAHRASQLAINTCISGLSPAAALSQRWHGLTAIKLLKALDERLENTDELTQFAAKLCTIQEHLLNSPRQLMVVSEEQHHEAIAHALTNGWQLHSVKTGFFQPFKPYPINQIVRQAWAINTQVNFCAQAYPTVASSHRDAPVLAVLSDFLRNGYLHRTIREQGGAYGGGARYEGDTGAFCLYSFRDPRLVDTLTDFKRALVWLQTHPHSKRSLEEAVLGIVSRIDRPSSPAGEALNSFFNTLHGRSAEHRREFRKRVLRTTIDDLQRVAMTYLLPERANIAVLGSAKTLDKLPQELRLERHEM